MPATTRFSIVASNDELARLRQLVHASCADLGLAEDVAARLVLAAHEACANVIAHGDPAGELRLLLHDGARHVVLEIIDDAAAFDPRTIPPLDQSTSARAVGGLGWHLVTSSVDVVDYRRDGDHNVLVLTVDRAIHGAS